ncbi:MAG: nitrogenase-stabilizing/protective protein NifW [Rhodocyclaceae bacterium]
MTTSRLQDELADLSTAEEFLDFFGIVYEPSVVQVNRLHILQRFHDYLGKEPAEAMDDAAETARHRRLLARAYEDFVVSDARTEKVFKVFHMHEPKTVFVPISEIFR